MELNSRVTVPSLFNLHARLSDAPDSTRPCKSPGRHMGRTIFSHPKSRHRPVQSSTLICLPSIAPSLNFYVLPSTPSLHLCHFPSFSYCSHSSLSLLALPPVISALSLSCPSLFLSFLCPFPFLPTKTLMYDYAIYFSLVCCPPTNSF